MYSEFYGLATRPFQLTPDARFFFESTVHRQAMAYLVYGLHHAEGFIIITGEVGAGKTILVDNLLSTINESSFITAKIVTSQLGGDDLLHMVAAGFGVAKEGLAKGSLLQRISDFVLAQHRDGKRVLLIVDEAQNLSFEALEELRMLSNIVVDRTMALQSFLLGQPQFRTILGSPGLEQLRQRVTAAYHLGPLNEAETRAYIEHRLRRAEWKDDPHFTEASFPVIYQHTEGVPRRINTLCSRLLLYGFLEQLHTLTASGRQGRQRSARGDRGGGPPSAPPMWSRKGRAGAAFPALLERLAALEKNVDQHDRLIRRAIEIAAHYFQGERHEPGGQVAAAPDRKRVTRFGADAGFGRRRRCAPAGACAGAMTIDVEDYFQVEAFSATIDRKDWDGCRNGSSATPNGYLRSWPRRAFRRPFSPWAV